jgi:glycosyltransferase involved in cell wall biosynthesis
MIKNYSYNISVLLVTYNHEKYIFKALSNIFEQKIEGIVELIIADDGSTDNTLQIIRDFENKNSNFHFKYLDNSKNLGITKNYQRGFTVCSGKYIAILEGDDYWSVNYKLQRQMDFLDAHPECDLCSSNYWIFEEELSKFTPRVTVSDGYRYIKVQDLIMDNLIGNFSTSMYRKSALLKLPEGIFELRSYDWIVNICVAQNSLIAFLEEPLSVYRVHQNGVWSSLSQLEKLREQAEIIPAYNALTNFQFDNEFNILLTRLNAAIVQKDSCCMKKKDASVKHKRYMHNLISRITRYFTSVKR